MYVQRLSVYRVSPSFADTLFKEIFLHLIEGSLIFFTSAKVCAIYILDQKESHFN